jgi:hypothetical protein
MAFGVMDAAKQLGIGWDTFHTHVAPNVKWVRGRNGRSRIVTAP